jgi:ATP-dependent Lon protease
MTGEITLRGDVLPIGGLKEKALAAKLAGIENVIVPRLNRRDLEEIPETIKSHLSFHFVDHMDEVLRLALIDDETTAGTAAADVSAAAPAADASRETQAA